MGAYEFYTTSRGKTAQQAFQAAVKEARFEHGHGGYTGTIAEKHSFKVIALPADKKATEYAEELMYANDKRVNDKYGPAGALQINKNTWLFFGWAPS